MRSEQSALLHWAVNIALTFEHFGSEDTPAKWLMKPKGLEEMVTWVSKECVLCDIEGAYRVQGRDGDDDLTGRLKVDVLVRRSAGFDVRRSLKAKICSAVRTIKRKTKLKEFSASISSGVCKVLYSGDPGKSAEAQCSLSCELESSTRMIDRAILKLHADVKAMNKKMDYNHTEYQKAFRDIVQSVEDLKKTNLTRFDAVHDKITAQTLTAKEDAGKIASLVSETSTMLSATSTKHDESFKTIQSAVYESANDLMKTVHETGQLLEEAAVQATSKRTALEAEATQRSLFSLIRVRRVRTYVYCFKTPALYALDLRTSFPGRGLVERLSMRRSGALSLKSRFQGVTHKLIGDIKSDIQARKSEPAVSEPAIDINDPATKSGLAETQARLQNLIAGLESGEKAVLEPAACTSNREKEPTTSPQPLMTSRRLPPLSMSDLKSNNQARKSEPAVSEPAMNRKEAGHTSNGRNEPNSSPQPSMTPRCLPPRPMASAARYDCA